MHNNPLRCAAHSATPASCARLTPRHVQWPPTSRYGVQIEIELFEWGLKAKGEMRAARLQELEEMAARLLALARKLPPGQQRHDIVQQIGRFRVQIAALKGPDLGRPHRGPKAKEK